MLQSGSGGTKHDSCPKPILFLLLQTRKVSGRRRKQDRGESVTAPSSLRGPQLLNPDDSQASSLAQGMTGPDVPGQGRAAGREGSEAPPSHQSWESVLALSSRACANVTSRGLGKVPIATANPAPAPWPGSGQFSMDTVSPAVQARRGL